MILWFTKKKYVQLIQSLACVSHVYVGENKWSSQMGIFHATLLFFYAPQGCSYLQRRWVTATIESCTRLVLLQPISYNIYIFPSLFLFNCNHENHPQKFRELVQKDVFAQKAISGLWWSHLINVISYTAPYIQTRNSLDSFDSQPIFLASFFLPNGITGTRCFEDFVQKGSF